MPARGYEFYLPVVIEDITWPRVDTNFIFECSTRYLVEHEKIKLVSSGGHVIFCLLYKNTNNDVFEEFPKISDHFQKISEDLSKFFRRSDERFQAFSKDFRR